MIFKKRLAVMAMILAAFIAVVLMTGSSATAHPFGSGWYQGFMAGNHSVAFAGHGYDEDQWLDGLDGSTSTYGSDQMNTDPGVAWIFNPTLSGNCTDQENPNNGCRIDLDSFPSGFDGAWKWKNSAGFAGGVATITNKPYGNFGVSGGTAKGALHQHDELFLQPEVPVIPIVFYDYNDITTMITFYTYDHSTYADDLEIRVVTERNDGVQKTTFHTIPQNGSVDVWPSDLEMNSCSGGTGSGFNNEDCIANVYFYERYPTSGETPMFGAHVYHALTWDIYSPVPKFIAAHSAILSNHDIEGNVFLPSLKNSYYADSASTVVYVSVNFGTTDLELDMRYVITGVESGCSGVSVGDVYTDSMTVPANEVRKISYADGNVGGMPNCVYYTGTLDDVNEENDGEEIYATVIETQYSTHGRMAAYNGQSIYAYPGGVTMNFPMYKEDFNEVQGGIAVMNVGNISGGEAGTCSEVLFTFYEGSSDEHVIKTDELCPGEGINVRRVSDGPSGKPWSTVSGGVPDDNEKYFVGVDVVDEDARIAAIYQDGSYGVSSSNKMDISNYEAAHEVGCRYSDPLAWCE